jgi:hypothetical protein
MAVLYVNTASMSDEARRTLLLGLMCEHGTERDVSDTLDAFRAGVKLIVDDDPSLLVRLNSDVLQAEILCHWSSSDRHEDDICFELPRPRQRHRCHGRSDGNPTVSSLPPFAASTLSLMVSFPCSAPKTFVLSLNLSPCFCRIFWNCFLRDAQPNPGNVGHQCGMTHPTSASIPAPTAPRYSTTVTSDPNLDHTDPNSNPMIPPPIITIYQIDPISILPVPLPPPKVSPPSLVPPSTRAPPYCSRSSSHQSRSPETA